MAAEQHPFAALDQFSEVAATFTGMRAQLEEQGWTRVHAEELIIELLRANNNLSAQ